MHPTAIMNCKNFFDVYSKSFSDREHVRVIEIGSQDVNGSLRSLCPKNFEYIGVDFVPGKGVDVILTDPYALPFSDEYADIVISSSCFEHSQMFWLVFLEVMRVLKPHGLFYLNVPSNGSFHRYPVDCWRFYPDSGNALIAWARRNKINASLLESFVCDQLDNLAGWNDFVAVFLKNDAYASDFGERIVDTFDDFKNGMCGEDNDILHFSESTYDFKKLLFISQVINNQIKIA
ncbi:MAG: class I SAM-dependent methyltransferase [Burkholderiales bacterium]|nr:class I SAM-dependent methyltransferase [Burkholderiales bacterium]MBK9348323.1 class I SAM-dependent methyltransferase [Burkholderiales bacterium]